MVDIIKDIELAKRDDFGRVGLNIITYIDENCNEYKAHVTDKGLEVAKLENRLLTEFKIPKEIIEDFRFAIYAECESEIRENDNE